MSNDAPPPPADGFPQGRPSDMRDLLLSPSTGGKPPSSPSNPWVPPTAEELHRLLPQYEIVKMLGRGGMGAVYMGRQTSLDRPVAIKILSGALEEADHGFTERFKNEAKAMAKLNHPGIVGVYDFGQTGTGLLYIVMEYVDGTDVSKMIAAEGRLHTEHAMAITAHVCDALAYAHERGIIHRDIKPANIMVGYDGVVKVADFGLAKVNVGGKTLGLTMSGMAMGTLHFMAPEALMLGSAVDHRADIYAVGVMLYQMLTGKLPQGMFKMPSLLVPGLDPRYDGIIAKALMEDREARYQSAREMRTDLDSILTQPVLKVEPASTGQAAALPTQARPQRPDGKPVMRQAAIVAPMQAPKTSLAWLWMTSLIVTMVGGVAWLVMDTQDKPVVASVSSSPADATISSTPPAVSPPAKTPAAPDTSTSVERFILGRWVRTNMDQPGLAYLMDLSADGSALWTGDNTTVRGTWQIKSGLLEVDWNSRFKFLITPPPSSSSSAILKGTANWPEGKSTEIVYERQTADAGETATLVETFNGHRYQFVPGALTWKEAKVKAESMGGHLATITSKEENEWLLLTFRKLLTTHNRNIWLGASEEIAGQGWKWVTGEPFVFTQWRPGEPNGSPVGRPYMLNLRSFKEGDVGWNDSSTHGSQSQTNIGFIVEWDSASPEITTPVPTGPTTWTDTKGRSLTATFKAIASGNVLLDIAGKVTHVPLNTLSPESQKLARAYHDQSNPATTNDPAQATKDRPFVNSLGMKFVPVPGTKVLFCIHETRKGDYAKFAAQNPELDSQWKGTKDDDSFPVVYVNWHEAKAFCAWLTQKYGVKHRLPTDREWSFAVGIGDLEDEKATPEALGKKNVNIYPWGGSWPPPNDVGNYLDEGINKLLVARGINQTYSDGHPGRAPVMQFKANVLGLHDLGGNVWEWCEDWFNASQTQRVMRGATWKGSDETTIFSARRLHPVPEDRSTFSDFGFRVVIELPTTSITSSVPSPTSANQASAPRNPAPATSLATATKDRPFVNTLGMKFVPVPGTKVLFCIHETRVLDYAAYVQDSGVNDKVWNQAFSKGERVSPSDAFPVVNINHESAKGFCSWLSEKESLMYRLPTDVEWSWAVGIADAEGKLGAATPAEKNCRIKAYPWGTAFLSGDSSGAGNFADQTWKAFHAAAAGFENYRDGFAMTSPVMNFRPNDLGIFDLGGNVWEICEDWMDQRQQLRVLRGGAWNITDPDQLLSSSRRSCPSHRSQNATGFRIVLELP